MEKNYRNEVEDINTDGKRMRRMPFIPTTDATVITRAKTTVKIKITTNSTTTTTRYAQAKLKNDPKVLKFCMSPEKSGQISKKIFFPDYSRNFEIPKNFQMQF